MNNLFYIIQVLPIITGIVWIDVIGGSNKVLKIGRSKNGYKKFKKSLTIKDRIFKLRYVSFSKGAIIFQYYFVIMTYLGYLCLIVLLVLWIVSLFTHNFWNMFCVFQYVKCYTFELPAFIFTFLNMRRSKDKVGFDWKFVDEYGL